MIRTQAPTRLGLERLDARDVPSAVHPHRFAVGTGAGQPAQVSVYEAGTNAVLAIHTPFGRGFTGGVRVATGDLTGDGIDDIAVAAGTGGPWVKVYDGATHTVVADFYAFSPTARVGSHLAIGDVTGDGRADLVAGAGEGLRAQVKVYRGQDLVRTVTTSPVGRSAAGPVAAATFFALGDAFTGGVRVAVGDVNGDGIGDIVAAPGAGAAPVVKVFVTRAAWGDAPGTRYRSDVTTMTVGGSRDTGGVFVAAADLDGDGKADVVVGRVLGTAARVTVYKGTNTRTKLLDASGFTSTEPGGVPVAVRDLDGDGRAEVLAGGGAGTPQVRVLGNRGGLVRSFLAAPPGYQGGVFVG